MNYEKFITMINSRLLEIFCTIIKIDALSTNEREIAAFISEFLKKLSLNPIEDSSAKITGGNCGNIICPVGDGGNFVVLSHMDTARSTKGVIPIILEDRITSDGSTVLGVDNRVGIACIIYAVEKAITNNIPLKDFTIAFTTQEETSLSGSMNLGVNGSIKLGFIFDSHLRPGNFIKESVGSLDFTIRVHGKASHSGLAPEKGIDSIKIASNAISRIAFGRLDAETTANIGNINGGTAVNVVAELTELRGEIRSIIPSKIQEKAQEIKDKFTEAAIESGGSVEFIFDWGFKPYTISPEQEVYKTVVKTLEKVGLTPNPNISWGGSDANSLNARGITSINLGIGAQNPHSNEEFILLEDLQKTAEIVLELIKK